MAAALPRRSCSPAPAEWKQAIVDAKSEHASKAEVLNDITPLPGTVGFKTVLRSLPTEFLMEWSGKRDAARRERDRLRGQIVSTTQAGRRHQGHPLGQRDHAQARHRGGSGPDADALARRTRPAAADQAAVGGAKPAQYRHYGRGSRAGQPRRLKRNGISALACCLITIF